MKGAASIKTFVIFVILLTGIYIAYDKKDDISSKFLNLVQEDSSSGQNNSYISAVSGLQFNFPLAVHYTNSANAAGAKVFRSQQEMIASQQCSGGATISTPPQSSCKNPLFTIELTSITPVASRQEAEKIAPNRNAIQTLKIVDEQNREWLIPKPEEKPDRVIFKSFYIAPNNDVVIVTTEFYTYEFWNHAKGTAYSFGNKDEFIYMSQSQTREILSKLNF